MHDLQEIQIDACIYITFIMSSFSLEIQSSKPFRYRNCRHGQEKSKGQVIPNPILFTDYSTITPTHIKKNKKFPLFMAYKKSPTKTIPQGNIFTNRGILSSSVVIENKVFKQISQRQVKHKYKKSEVLTRNPIKIDFTPFNFMRPKTPRFHAHSVSNISSDKDIYFTPTKLQLLTSRPEDNKRKKFRKTISYFEKHSKTEARTREQADFKGWQTAKNDDQQIFG